MKVLVGPARAWAGVAPPEPGASLSWSGVPASITRSLGTTYDLSQHVEYDGEESLTYSSIGTSLSGTGISLNTSTGVLTIDGGASTGTVSGIQIRVSDGTLIADSSAFSVEKVDELPLLYQSDIEYVGAFKLFDAGWTLPDSFDGGGMGVGYYPAGNSGQGSLYITGYEVGNYVAEVSIPTPVDTANHTLLPRATALQTLIDAAEGKASGNNNDFADGTGVRICGFLVAGDRLVFCAKSQYDATGEMTLATHASRPLNLSTTGSITGPKPFSLSQPIAVGRRWFSGAMGWIPEEWRDAFGGPAFTTCSQMSINSGYSNGPSFTVFDPADIETESAIPGQLLQGYPLGHELEETVAGESNILWNFASSSDGVAFPSGCRTVLHFVRFGAGDYGYGDGTATYPPPVGYVYDPADTSKGTHAYPYRYQVQAYDANDLLDVKAGTKLPYELRPYAHWEISLPFAGDTAHRLTACCDPVSNRIFVVQRTNTWHADPIVHVLQVT